MSEDKLEKYIKDNLSKGYSEEKIILALEKAGHHKDRIASSMKKVKQKKPNNSKLVIFAFFFLILIAAAFLIIKFSFTPKPDHLYFYAAPVEECTRQNITNAALFDQCIEGFKEPIMNLEDCSTKLRMTDAVELCKILVNDDIALCDQSVQKDFCRMAFAAKNNNTEICKVLADINMQTLCKNKIKLEKHWTQSGDDRLIFK